MKKWLWTTVAGVGMIGVFLWIWFSKQMEPFFFQPTVTSFTQVKESPEIEMRTEVVATNLRVPWDLAFLPDNSILITERAGVLKWRKTDGSIQTILFPEVLQVGESGLLGLVLHPRFPETRWIYFYQSYPTLEGERNRVVRWTWNEGRLVDEKIIIDQIPGAVYHDGGHIAFGPDGDLYISTGDATQPNLAQDLKSLAGKILRVKEDGSIPEDNPFKSAVYSVGHRNVQGFDWDDHGRLWATEHGRSGVLSGYDELNLIEKGKNYGWPIVQGPEEKTGMVSPVFQSGAKETWAPAAIAWVDGRLFFTGLRGESMYEVRFDTIGNPAKIEAHWRSQYGRLRALRLGPDGKLYLTTSNTDGRGKPSATDDVLIRVDARLF